MKRDLKTSKSQASAPKALFCVTAFLVFLSTLNYPPSTLFAQGPLTPPGAPSPSMKSLDQIEARTPISSLPFTISTSGSYYLANNLSVSAGNGLTINADKVTVDLNGFTISSTAASATGTGILLTGTRTNITIQNGYINGTVTQSGGSYSGGGFANGIAFTAEPSNVRVSGLTVSGCLSGGIILHFNNTVVESCLVNTVGSYGIYAQAVSNSSAVNCGFDGMQVQTAENCFGSSVTAGTGLYANLGAVNSGGTSSSNDGLYALNATNCFGQSATGMHGLNAFSANNCYGYHGGSGAGINADEVHNSYGQSVSGTGINANTATGCYGISNTGFGINANSVTASYGFTSNSSAIRAKTVGGSYGESATGIGINADNVSGSYGVTTSGFGITASTASNCYASAASGTGIATYNAIGCWAQNNGSGTYAIQTTMASYCNANNGGGTAITVGSVASYCYGANTGANPGVGLSASVAIACAGSGNPIAVSATQKFLGTP